MTVVDYERLVVKLKAHIVGKKSHGQRELLETLARLEVECAVPEGQEAFTGLPLDGRTSSVRQPVRVAV